MSTNKYRPHILVLPEDAADSELALGFFLYDPVALRELQVLREAGGWAEVRDKFGLEHVPEMRRYRQRYMVLLVDFDGQPERGDEMRKAIPRDLTDRVFVIGVWEEPEDLQRQQLGNNEAVCRQLARECRENRRELWNHELLAHNAAELDRMNGILRPILFPAN
ncbi:MAG: hypothetical protein WEB58_05125 [Planctomycetaceae bacterium]